MVEFAHWPNRVSLNQGLIKIGTSGWPLLRFMAGLPEFLTRTAGEFLPMVQPAWKLRSPIKAVISRLR